MLHSIKTFHKAALCIVLLAAAGIFPFVTNVAQAQQRPPIPHLSFKAADPKEKGDGTINPAAREAIIHGPLPMSEADVAAKAAANKASDEFLKAMKKGTVPGAPPARRTDGSVDDTAAGPKPAGPKPLGRNVKPLAAIVGGINIGGQTSQGLNPSDSTGAIGPVNFIQLVNSQAALYDKKGNLLVVPPGKNNPVSLATLAGTAPTRIDDPQIIWDSTSLRFYYTMREVFSANDNRLAFGFSKSPSVVDLSDAWCHYEVVGFGATVPDFPKLGDSQDFAIIGVNSFVPTGLPPPTT